MIINYDDMTTMTIEELKNLYNELGGVINERAKADRLKAIEKAEELVMELNKLMDEYDIILEVEDWDDNCCIRTNVIIGMIK
jgi:hypothetical protein